MQKWLNDSQHSVVWGLAVAVFLCHSIFSNAWGRTNGQVLEPGTNGDVTADTGFRAEPDGFSFENWGGSQYAHGNLTIEEARCLFGDRVCARIINGQCVPTPAAKMWLAEMNQSMTGGHCEGMAALSAAFFTGLETPQTYGAERAFDLDPGNALLLRSIGVYFVTQGLEPIASQTARTREMSLADIVATLSDALASENEYYTLGIYGADGGHAITPYAVEEVGDGKFLIHVYDNNYPGAGKYVEVDTHNDVWRYAGAALNPAEDSSPWEGSSGAMDITALSSRYEPVLCPFCGDSNATAKCRMPEAGASTPPPISTPPAADAPSTEPGPTSIFTSVPCESVTVVDQHSGQRISMEGGKIVSEIAGAILQSIKGRPGCYIQLPSGSEYSVSVSGDSDRPAQSSETTIFRPGSAYNISGITMHSGQEDQMVIGAAGFSYVAGADVAPTLTLATDNPDGEDRYYVVDGFELQEGFQFEITALETGQFQFNSDDPELTDFNIDMIISDADEDREYAFDDVEFDDDGQALLELDDDGNPDWETADDADDDEYADDDEDYTDDEDEEEYTDDDEYGDDEEEDADDDEYGDDEEEITDDEEEYTDDEYGDDEEENMDDEYIDDEEDTDDEEEYTDDDEYVDDEEEDTDDEEYEPEEYDESYTDDVEDYSDGGNAEDE